MLYLSHYRSTLNANAFLKSVPVNCQIQIKSKDVTCWLATTQQVYCEKDAVDMKFAGRSSVSLLSLYARAKIKG